MSAEERLSNCVFVLGLKSDSVARSNAPPGKLGSSTMVPLLTSFLAFGPNPTLLNRSLAFCRSASFSCLRSLERRSASVSSSSDSAMSSAARRRRAASRCSSRRWDFDFLFLAASASALALAAAAAAAALAFSASASESSSSSQFSATCGLWLGRGWDR